MSSITRSLSLVGAAALIAAFGCTSTSSAPELPSAPAAEQATPISEMTGPDVEVREEQAELAPVYFDTNVAELGSQARSSLKSYAESILDHPEWGLIRIDGHCDERGSDQYNRTLGKRRAAAVQHHLVKLGVPAARLATRTFGSQRPAVRGHGEQAWRYNRRSELTVGDSLASN